ncbi:hypothetical protein MIR68_009791 [Amoeboaphelidium protococcarum]|nr:hypothetical protein MIR68_009791 [Amoeboaphelidium protococcarum]
MVPPGGYIQKYLLCKSYFDLKDYKRCYNSVNLNDNNLPSVIKFIALYAEYFHIIGQEISLDIVNGEAEQSKSIDACQQQRTRLQSNQFMSLLDQIKTLLSKEADCYLYYLQGLVYARVSLSQKAKESFVKSIQMNSTFWGSWFELAKFMQDWKMVESVIGELPEHVNKISFIVQVASEIGPSPGQSASVGSVDQVQLMLTDLQKLFPQSQWLESKRASIMYYLRDFESASEIFRELMVSDPYNVEITQTYSNVLFVQDDSAALSTLAHHLVKNLDPQSLRPETCFVLGNYFSMKGLSANAILMFDRAVKLFGADNQYRSAIDLQAASAYTLMGHEYIEARNTDAALDSYQKAIQICPSDYRAWYGLGQAYEMLQMPVYSIYYFQKAVKLRPHDGRLWIALANIYEVTNQLDDAVRSYKKSLSCHSTMKQIMIDPSDEIFHGSLGTEATIHDETLSSQEFMAMSKIAQLYEQLNKKDLAVKYWKLLVDSILESEAVAKRTGEEVEYPAGDLMEALAKVVDFMKIFGASTEQLQPYSSRLYQQQSSNC